MLELVHVDVAAAGNKKQLLLSDVNLKVASGETVALLGPSGSGKSTLLRAIAGLAPVPRGEILWDGSDITSLATHKRDFGMVFQDAQLFTHRTVAKNIAYGLESKQTVRWARQQRVRDMLELVRLPEYGSRRVSSLSGGEAQRVALARALAPQPRLLLLDEPLSALDAELRETLGEELRELLKQQTAIFVTHDIAEAKRVADRIVRLADITA